MLQRQFHYVLTALHVPAGIFSITLCSVRFECTYFHLFLFLNYLFRISYFLFIYLYIYYL